MQHVKPHGALYHDAASREPVARALVQAVADFDPDLILVTPAGPVGDMIRKMARDHGLRTADEAFADRAYTADGRLVPRGEKGSLIQDAGQVARRSTRLATKGVADTIEGGEVALNPHTICLHGDTPGAVELAAAVRTGLEEAGVQVQPLDRLV
jgi:UPF0271 protein